MPTKKKKYNARFPPARIKKIMQKDEEVGKVASTVPVMISRLLELFTEALILKTNELTLSVNARTLTTSHLKQVILSERKFDFLKELVTHIPDVQVNDEDGGDSNSDQGIRVRQRGRPRKKKEDEVSSVPKKRGRKPKAAAPTVEDEDLTDSSETEDADSCSDEDGGDSTSEDAVVEGRGSYQSQKRQRVDGSFGPTCSSYVSANCAGVVESGAAESYAPNPGSSSTVLADRNGGLFQPPEPTALRFWNMPTASGNSVVGRTASETCLPLNLATAVPAASAVASASDFNSEPHSIQLLTRPNFEGTTFGTSVVGTSSAPPGLRVLRPPPPPAHQVFTPPVVPSCMLSLNSRSSQLPQVASGFLRRLDSTGTLASQSAAPASGGSAAEDAPVGSHVSSDGTPPITTSSMPSSSGHATHRMPVVSASFLPGAVLVRSMSLPHSCSTTKTSLVTLPEDDYDS